MLVLQTFVAKDLAGCRGMIPADRELRWLGLGTVLRSRRIGDVAFLYCDLSADVETPSTPSWVPGAFTHGVKMVGRVALVALEAAHGAIVFGRGLAVAIEAGQGLVELSGLGRHCEDRTIALSLELKETRAEGWVGGWSVPRDCFVFSSLCWRGEVRGCNEEWTARSRTSSRCPKLLVAQ